MTGTLEAEYTGLERKSPEATWYTRSYSQLSQYQRCPYSFYLQRVKKVYQKPAAWLSMGTAVHYAAEEYEKWDRLLTNDQAKDAFRKSYAEETSKMLEETPNADYWFSSGPYKGPEDIVRRYRVGLEHVDRYIKWYTDHPEETVWLQPTGEPAIEMSFTIDLGGVPVRGFLDQVIATQSHGIVVRDIKTGTQPGNSDQLKLYALAVEELSGVDVLYGDYFMTKVGKPTEKFDLSVVSRQETVDVYGELDQRVIAGKFDPTPSENACRMCSSKHSCEYAVA
jgi:putative RecB family exonuclease